MSPREKRLQACVDEMYQFLLSLRCGDDKFEGVRGSDLAETVTRLMSPKVMPELRGKKK